MDKRRPRLVAGLILASLLAGLTMQCVMPHIDITFPTPTPSPALHPTPSGDLSAVQLWMTWTNDPNGEHVTSVPKDRLTELWVWMQADQPGSVMVLLYLSGPMGSGPWGPPENPELEIAPGGGPTHAGRFGSAMMAGEYLLECKIGETVVGSLTFQITE